MKLLVCVVVLSLFAMSSATGPDLSTAEGRSEMIRSLQARMKAIKSTIPRLEFIGKKNLALFQRVLIAADERRFKCLTLETLRPAPIPMEPFPEVPLQPVTETLTLAQITARIGELNRQLKAIGSHVHRFIQIGKSNIGTMHRFAEMSRNAICGADHYSPCPIGFLFDANSDLCYHESVGRYKTFAEAQEHCHSRGGHLPRIQSADQNNAIAGMMQPLVSSPDPSDNSHAVWIGLHRNDDNVWQWVHPSDSPVDLSADDSYTNFKSDEEDAEKSCGYLCLMSNKWVKTSCSTETRVICERAKNPRPEVTTEDD